MEMASKETGQGGAGMLNCRRGLSRTVGCDAGGDVRG